MHLYLIRHGESTANKEKAFQGWNNVHLSDQGILQAKKLSEYFQKQNIQFSSIFSSSLVRALETAEPLKIVANDSRIVPIEAFKSINVGNWGGILISKVKGEFPGEYAKWRNSPEEFCFPGGESLADVRDRAHTAMMNILKDFENLNQNIAIISHMITIKVIALTVLEERFDLIWDNEYVVPNTGIMIFDVKKERIQDRWSFSRVDLSSSTPHLEE